MRVVTTDGTNNEAEHFSWVLAYRSVDAKLWSFPPGYQSTAAEEDHNSLAFSIKAIVQSLDDFQFMYSMSLRWKKQKKNKQKKRIDLELLACPGARYSAGFVI